LTYMSVATPNADPRTSTQVPALYQWRNIMEETKFNWIDCELTNPIIRSDSESCYKNYLFGIAKKCRTAIVKSYNFSFNAHTIVRSKTTFYLLMSHHGGAHIDIV
jgi:hypothetical protein